MTSKRCVKKRSDLFSQFRCKSLISSRKASSSLGRKIFATVFLLIMLIFGYYFSLNGLSFTGKAVLSINGAYNLGDPIQGNVKINLREGEFLPASTKVFIDNSGNVHEYLLSDLVNSKTSQGKFFIEDKELSGSGLGYGVLGEKNSYPKVNFVLQIIDPSVEEAKEYLEKEDGAEKDPTGTISRSRGNSGFGQSQGNQNPGEGNQGQGNNNSNNEQGNQGQNNSNNNNQNNNGQNQGNNNSNNGQGNENNNGNNNQGNGQGSGNVVSEEENSEQSLGNSGNGNGKGVGKVIDEDSEESSSLLTGETILEGENYISGEVVKGVRTIKGSVSRESPFSYSIKSNENARIISSEEDVNLEVIGEKIFITTNYPKEEKGYGEEFLGDYAYEMDINLGDLNLIATEGDFVFKLDYNGEGILLSKSKVSVAKSEFFEVDLTDFEDVNFSETKSLTVVNQSVVESPLGVININTTQYTAVVGGSVKWKQRVSSNSSSLSVHLPAGAKNITVYSIEDYSSSQSDSKEGEITFEGFDSNSGKAKVKREVPGESIKVSKDSKGAKNILDSITGNVVSVDEQEDKVEVYIDEGSTEYEIEYETPGPSLTESETGRGKLVKISSDIHYQNILSYSELEFAVPVSDIKLYHYVNDKKVPSEFQSYDSNGELISGDEVVLDSGVEDNSSVKEILNESVGIDENVLPSEEKLAKYITWVVPHTSEQTYEIIIEITNAEHLDSERNFVKNIYEDVRALDGNWSPVINDSEYVRVTFEQPLTNVNDITIYARPLGDFSSLEVYLEDGIEIIAEIENITEEGLYKTYLTGIPGGESYSVFDLRVFGSPLEFDYIVDPIIVNSSTGTGTNVTQENQFAHINISDPSLILYMPFDVEEDSSNITYDYTNQSNDGTLNNTPTWTDSGYIGGAYDFSGSSSADSIIVSNYTPFNGINEITYSVWINPSVGGDFDAIIASRGSTFNSVGFSNSLGLVNGYVNSQPSQIENAYTLGNWTHIVATWRNSAAGGDGIVRIYSNGVEGSYTVVGGTNSSTNVDDVMRIGWDDLNVGRTFTGMIDEVMIFNRSLSPTEILELYNSTYDRFYPTGEMLFENLDFGSNNTVNISIPLAQQLNGSDIQFKINDGSYVSLNSTGDYEEYSFTPTGSDNLTLKLDSNAFNFYSPLVVGNLSLDSWEIIPPDNSFPNISVNSPLNQTYSTSETIFNITAVDNVAISHAWFSLDGNDNLTLTNSVGNFYTLTNSSMTEGQHNVTFWINDTSGNLNQSGYVYFFTDSIAPQISFTTGTEDDYASVLQTYIYSNVSLIEDNLGDVSYSLYNESFNKTGLIGYWNFDRNTTSVRDISGNGNDGTLVSSPVFNSSGYLGSAYTLDGTNYIDTADFSDFNGLNEITYSVWINPSVGGGFDGIITSRGSTFNAVDFSNSAGLINTYVNSQPSQIENAYTLGNWTHIVATWRNSAAGGDGIVRIYSNGVEGSYTVVGGTNSSTNFDDVLRIGWDDSSAGRKFVGSIDEVMIFNRSLSEAEILELYNRQLVNRTSYDSAVTEITWEDLGDNDYHYFVDALDTVENYNFTELRNINVLTDATPPTINVQSPTNTTYSTSTIWFNATADESISTWNLNYNGTNVTEFTINTSLTVEDGSHQLLLYASDSASNVGLNDSIYFTVDTTSPLIDFTSGTEDDYSNVSRSWIFVNVSATETNEANITFNLYNSSGLVNSTISTSSQREINFTDLSDEVYSYNVTLFDIAGNSNSTSTRTITLDTTNPLISFTTGTEDNNSYFARDYIFMNTSVTDINFRNLTLDLYFDNGTLYDSQTFTDSTREYNWTGLSNGVYLYNATTFDFSGNSNSTDLRYIVLDTTNPLIEISFPENTTYGSNVSELNFTYTEINADYCWYSMDGGTTNSTLDSSCGNFSEITSSEGSNTWTVYINDTAGNFNSSSVTFFKDSVNPLVSFEVGTEDNNSYFVRDYIFVNTSVTEINEDTLSFELYNSSSLVNLSSYLDSTREINFTSLPEETYYYNVTVNDSAGNSNSTETRILTLDATNPEVSVTLPVDGNIYTSSSVTFQITTNENSTCEYSTDSGTTNNSLNANSDGTIHSATETGISNAAYTVNYYCDDLAGNTNNTEGVSYTVSVSSGEVSDDSGGSGGGGGGGSTTIVIAPPVYDVAEDSDLDYSFLELERTLSLNRIELGQLDITNNGDVQKTLRAEVETLNSIVSVEESSITISSGETGRFNLRFTPPKETGIYTGTLLIISEEKIVMQIPIIMNVKTEKTLFDIILTIPDFSKSVKVSENSLFAQVDLLQMGIKEKIDVTLNYEIKDFAGQVYFVESETIAIVDQKSLEKEFPIDKLPSGDYVLGTEIVYPDGVAVASSQFKVKPRFGISFNQENIGKIILFISLTVVLVIVGLVVRRYRKLLKSVEHRRHR